MAITIEQVPKWYTNRGVGHAVASADDGVLTACGSYFLGTKRDIRSRRPKRICAKCRAALKDCVVVTTRANDSS